MMAVCPEHPMWGQNPIFTPLRETTSIPTPFICGVHPPGCMPWRRTTQISLPYLRSGRSKDENLSLSPLENVLADQEMLGLPEHAKYGKSELRKRGTHMAKNALCDWLEPRGLARRRQSENLALFHRNALFLKSLGERKWIFEDILLLNFEYKDRVWKTMFQDVCLGC